MKKVLSVCIFISLFSCLDEFGSTIRVSKKPKNLDEVFDSYWALMNSNYVYWDMDTTMWDQVYATYKPLFHELDITDKDDVLQSINYLKSISAGLVDCHYAIKFTSPYIDFPQNFSPSLVRKQAEDSYREPFDFENVVIPYLDPDFRRGSDFTSAGNGQRLHSLSGIIQNKFLYFSCNAFYLNNAYINAASDNKAVLDYFFENLKKAEINLKGIIIDLRGNTGGQTGDLNFFIGKFLDSPLHYGYTRAKYGSGRYDYTPWIKSYINPQNINPAVTLPITVIVDMHTASVAELASIALRRVSSSFLIGETTYGATGPVTLEEVYAAGQFEVSEFMSVTSSSVAFKTFDNKIYEGVGVTPDLICPFSLDSLLVGRDMQLEQALLLMQ
jgi:carboxyl-terminal processing protease